MEIDIRIIKAGKIKESIFCYWELLHEEYIKNYKKYPNNTLIKASILEKENKKYYNRIILSLKNTKKTDFESEAEIIFIEIAKYIVENQDKTINMEQLLKYFKEEDKNILFVAIRNIR